MHRTQIYLQDTLHDSLKARARGVGISISELIRRTLERDIQKDPVTDARAYFARLKPLQSFSETTAQAYVHDIRGTSRLLKSAAK
jgi:Ribbon-helix-helix protein, copG family